MTLPHPSWISGSKADMPLRKTSHAVLGPRRRKKHQWISNKNIGTIDEHLIARLCGNKVLARRLATKRKQQLRRDETAWYSRIADETEDANRTGNCEVLYRTLTCRTASRLPPVTAKDGSPSSFIIRQPLCPVVGRRPQHVVSKLPCLVLSSAIILLYRSSICPGRLSTAWLVSLVVFSCHMVSKR